jgi:hypothetical protein
MAQDRALDRHRTTNYPYRPAPPDLLERLDERVGAGKRSEVLSDLLARYLDGRAMPTRPWRAGKPDKAGRDHGE